MFLLVLFACKNLFLLYKSSKRRKLLKPENLETIFLLSALKKPIKSSLATKHKYGRVGSQVSKMLRGVAHKGGRGRGLTVSEVLGGGLGKKG